MEKEISKKNYTHIRKTVVFIFGSFSFFYSCFFRDSNAVTTDITAVKNTVKGIFVPVYGDLLLFAVVTDDVFIVVVVVVVCFDDVDAVLVTADVSVTDDFFVLVVVIVVVIVVLSDVIGAGMASIQTDFEIFSAVWISDLSLLKGKPSA